MVANSPAGQAVVRQCWQYWWYAHTVRCGLPKVSCRGAGCSTQITSIFLQVSAGLAEVTREACMQAAESGAQGTARGDQGDLRCLCTGSRPDL